LDLLFGETNHFSLGVIRNFCALTGTANHARSNNKRDHRPRRRHAFSNGGHDASLQRNSTLSTTDLITACAMVRQLGDIRRDRRTSSHSPRLMAAQ
jgi:hypothetical protein